MRGGLIKKGKNNKVRERCGNKRYVYERAEEAVLKWLGHNGEDDDEVKHIGSRGNGNKEKEKIEMEEWNERCCMILEHAGVCEAHMGCSK